MTKEQLVKTYHEFMHAFDMRAGEVVVDKTCMDVIMGKAPEVEKLSLMLDPFTARFVADITVHEIGNTAAMWAFLGSLDLHAMFDRPRTITFEGIIGSVESFLVRKPAHTLH